MHRRSETGMQEVIQMCSSFDANKSTKGASKLRRDLINGEIANLRDLLPLPSSTRQRLSQLQLMALVCVYVRKANYFQQVFKRHHELGHPYSTPNIGFSKALSGFLIMMTQNGKLLYISDNAAEYLGHSMEDLLIHGDSVYDIIDKADHGTVQAELLRSSNSQNPPGEETRLFLCRMNVSRNARRQMRFGDQKVVLLQGHFLSYLPLCSRNEPVFVATCTPVAMPETRECVVQGATNVFTTIHAMDMKFMHIDRNGEYYLGYTRSELGGISWYQLIHWNYMREAQSKHRLISQSEQEKSCILLLRLQTRAGDWIWVHCVLQVKDGSDTQQQQQSVIVATNQVLSEREAAVMRANSWLYHYYTVQTKLQYGLAYPEATVTQGSPTAAAAAARLAAAAYFPTPQLINYSSHSPHHLHHHHHHHPHHHPHHPHAHHQISPDTSGGYTTAMPPPLHSPHNGSYTSPSAPGHPYHHHHHQLHHAFEMSATGAGVGGGGGGGGGKESPLDFSLAASSVFEFPMPGAYTPGSSYWTHHHHPHAHPHPHGSHGYSNSTNASNNAGSVHSRAIEGSPSSTVSSSALSPHTWSLLPSSSTTSSNSHHTTNNHNTSNTHNSHQQTHHASTHSHSPSSSNSSTRISNLSPNTNNSNGSSSRKRLKKNTEVVSETSSPPLSSHRSSSSTNGFILPNGASGGSGPAGSDCSVATLSTPFPYHARHRGYYKVFGSSQEIEEHVPVKEESLAVMTMACPLTPSPIWEGQTQRVPDLQFYCSEREGQSGGAPGGLSSSGTDLIHCVPTYQPYLPFCSTTNPTVSALGTAAMQMQMHMMESGSPNKENRLPPTPESDQSENDENRPIKWETL